jgi:hypothetical protein
VEYHTDSSLYLQEIQILEEARLQLNRILALDPDTLLVIEDTIVIEYNLLYENLLQLTMENNTSLQIERKKQILSELDMKLINSKMYPVLRLNGGYNFTKSEAQAGVLLENKQAGWNYGATVSYPLLDRLDVHRQRKNARLETENSRLNLENLEQEVLSNLNEIYLAYQDGIKLVELEKQNLNVAHDNLNIAMEQFRLGNLSGIEMREITHLPDAEYRLRLYNTSKTGRDLLKQISEEFGVFVRGKEICQHPVVIAHGTTCRRSRNLAVSGGVIAHGTTCQRSRNLTASGNDKYPFPQYEFILTFNPSPCKVYQLRIMKQLIECVPNFSEGCNMKIIGQITAEIKKVEGVKLLDVDPGKATNRTVVTFVGTPDAVCEAAFRAVKKASELTMRTIMVSIPASATDMSPYRFPNITMEEVVVYARKLARRIGETGNSVYCYEFAAFEEMTQPCQLPRVNMKDWQENHFKRMETLTGPSA